MLPESVNQIKVSDITHGPRHAPGPFGGEWRGTLQHLDGVVAHVVLVHFLAHHVFGDDALVQALAQQAEKKALLISVWMALVAAKQRIISPTPIWLLASALITSILLIFFK